MAHAHSVFDTDARFTINPITRAIRNQTEGKVILMQGDHDSEVLTFECPRFIEGHDMAQSTQAQVHFDNEGNRDRYTAKDLAVFGNDESKVCFSWRISRNATGKAGKLSFLVKFRCYSGSDIEYEWNSDSYELTIKEGKDYDASEIVKDTDAIAKLRAELMDEIVRTFDSRLKVEEWTFSLDSGEKLVKEVWVP